MTRRLVLAVAVLGLLAGRARADIVVAAAGVTAGPETATVALAGLLMSWLAVQGWVTRTGASDTHPYYRSGWIDREVHHRQ